MSKETDVLVDIDDLDYEAASEKGFEFEYIKPDGARSGIFLTVLGGESLAVKAATNDLMDERRRKEAIIDAQTRPGRVKPIDKSADDVAFGKRLAAARLVGWRGIKQPYSSELALKLVTKNSEIAAQVMAESENLGNFTQPSSPIS